MSIPFFFYLGGCEGRGLVDGSGGGVSWGEFEHCGIDDE